MVLTGRCKYGQADPLFGSAGLCRREPPVRNVLDMLRSEEKFAGWLEDLERAPDQDIEVVLPRADDLPAILLDLAVPHEDINEIVAWRPLVLEDSGLRWLLERCVRGLVRGIGGIGARLDVPHLPPELGPVGRYFY